MSRGVMNCQVPGCDQAHYGRGFCHKHYERWRRHGSPLVVNIRGRKPHVAAPAGCWRCGAKKRSQYTTARRKHYDAIAAMLDRARAQAELSPQREPPTAVAADITVALGELFHKFDPMFDPERFYGIAGLRQRELERPSPLT